MKKGNKNGGKQLLIDSEREIISHDVFTPLVRIKGVVFRK